MRKAILLLLCFAFGQSTIRSADSTKPPVIITAPAKLERRGDWIYLKISDPKHRYEFEWASPPHSDGLVTLVSNRVYTFTVIEEPFLRNVFIPHVAKVEQDGKTIYDRAVCDVHNIKMEHKKVQIVYGLIRRGTVEPSAEIERQLFPHHREISFGGCVVDSESPKTTKIYVCDQCKKAYDKWKAGNRSTR